MEREKYRFFSLRSIIKKDLYASAIFISVLTGGGSVRQIVIFEYLWTALYLTLVLIPPSPFVYLFQKTNPTLAHPWLERIKKKESKKERKKKKKKRDSIGK